MAKKDEFDVANHILVPKHTKLSEEEKEALFQKYNISEYNLPKILKADPAIKSLGAKVDDVIKIERASPTAGKSLYYRAVI
ncbi:MAG: DNA-directed RNA polymerase subunit H [Candidatus Woesearchaeota archaeon]